MNGHEILVSVVLPAACCILALVSLFFSIRAGRRRMLIDNLPTSRTTGVFIGLVELKGTAEASAPLTGYLSESPCVWYSWQVEEHWSRTVTETYTDSKGNTRTRTKRESGWKTVDSGMDSVPFYLQDESGCILIRPDGAKIEPVQVFMQTCTPGDYLYYGKGPDCAVMDSDHQRRFTECAIPLHHQLYVMGQSRERDDVIAPEIAADPQAEMFLISTRSEDAVSSGLKWTFRWLGLLGLVLAVAAPVVRAYMADGSPALAVPLGAAAGVIYLFVWFVCWFVMMYNSLVQLRQRVRQAWANVDVQLKRRNDLIPKLVEMTKGLRDYERELQVELAGLRAQLTATAPGLPGPDPQACSKSLIAVAEKYPELKANGMFLALQRNLSDTEDRISLARGYFNDIATFYNTRLEVIPDRFIAALGMMKPQTLMTADQFERRPVTVDLAQ